MRISKIISGLVLSTTLAVGGVSVMVSHAPAQQRGHDGTVDGLPADVVLAKAPVGATTIADARKVAKVGDTVTVKGRVALGKDAFSGGRGTVTVEDAPADEAAKPNPEARALVAVIEKSGERSRQNLTNKGGLRAGVEVYIVAKVAEVKPGAPLSLHATGLYVVPPQLPTGFFVSAMPVNALTVEKVKANKPKVGDKVTIRGRIGGSGDPFVDGRAVFTIVGPEIKACSDIPGDACKEPWDYCCEPKESLAKHSATIRVLDAAHEPVRMTVKGQGGLRELSDVVVVGVVSQVKGNALVVNATGAYVAPAKTVE